MYPDLVQSSANSDLSDWYVTGVSASAVFAFRLRFWKEKNYYEFHATGLFLYEECCGSGSGIIMRILAGPDPQH